MRLLRMVGVEFALALAASAAARAPVPPEQLVDAIGRAQAATEGTGGPLLHAFVDPRCGACIALKLRLEPLIRAGRLKVRWIPVQVSGNAAAAPESVQANTALLALLLSGAVLTPTLAYRAADSGLRVQVGAPDDLRSLLREAR